MSCECHEPSSGCLRQAQHSWRLASSLAWEFGLFNFNKWMLKIMQERECCVQGLRASLSSWRWHLSTTHVCPKKSLREWLKRVETIHLTFKLTCFFLTKDFHWLCKETRGTQAITCSPHLSVTALLAAVKADQHLGPQIVSSWSGLLMYISSPSHIGPCLAMLRVFWTCFTNLCHFREILEGPCGARFCDGLWLSNCSQEDLQVDFLVSERVQSLSMSISSTKASTNRATSILGPQQTGPIASTKDPCDLRECPNYKACSTQVPRALNFKHRLQLALMSFFQKSVITTSSWLLQICLTPPRFKLRPAKIPNASTKL